MQEECFTHRLRDAGWALVPGRSDLEPRTLRHVYKTRDYGVPASRAIALICEQRLRASEIAQHLCERHLSIVSVPLADVPSVIEHADRLLAALDPWLVVWDFSGLHAGSWRQFELLYNCPAA